jgi:hypothetical protein
LPLVLQLSHKVVLQNCHTSKLNCVTKIKTADFQLVNQFQEYSKENNPLHYLRTTYSSKDVDAVKNRCHIGTSNTSWTVFWLINKNGNAQKA